MHKIKIVNGFNSASIRLRILLRIVILAFSTFPNPNKSLRLIKAIINKRKKIHNLPPIDRFVYAMGKYFWSEDIPGWPSSNLDKFLKAELLRSQQNKNKSYLLHTVIFAITSRCKLRCSHCFEWDRISKDEYISLNDLLKILDKLQSSGLTHIQFSGGEPLVRLNDLLVLIEKAHKTMDCWILTSGFGLTYQKAELLSRVGLTGANISLDHWDEKIHNQFRNNNKSFYWVNQAVYNCRKAGILVSLSICATNSFISNKNLKAYMELAREWGVGFIRILEPRDTGRFKHQDVQLKPEKIELLRAFFQETYRSSEYRDYPIVSYPGYHQRKVGCFGAGNRYLYIDSKGQIHACPFCQNDVGNALYDSLETSIDKLQQKGCDVFKLSKFM